MGLLSVLNHLLNFVAPALAVALLLVLASRFLLPQEAKTRTLAGQLAINGVVGCAVLGAGLVQFGQDGRMLTYGALVLACATSQWLWLRGWRG